MEKGARFRLCRSCGRKWNVSVKNDAGKKYICPQCEKRKNAHKNSERGRYYGRQEEPDDRNKNYDARRQR